MINEYLVIVKKLCYQVGFKTILEDISFALKKTEFVGVIGGSGSGKTTLLTCLNGYREPTRGKVFLNNINVLQKEKIQKWIGYVPQEDIVHLTLDVERALYFSYLLRVAYEVPDEQVHKEVDRILDLLDMKEHKHKKIATLSGGQRKRVSIGIELLHSPMLFFLDEPAAGLDPGLERQLMRLLKTLAFENRLILVSTHLMQNIDLFDILIFMHKGKMIYFGPSHLIQEYFGVKSMMDCFDKVIGKSPEQMMLRYMQSNIYKDFLIPRLVQS